MTNDYVYCICFPCFHNSPISAKLLVASGDNPDNEENFVYKVEVIDLLNSSRTCKEWADLPDDLGRIGAFGGFIEDGLLMCCGDDAIQHLGTCHHITNTNTVKTTNVSFEAGFIFPGSVVLDYNKLLLVTGGLSKISIFS